MVFELPYTMKLQEATVQQGKPCRELRSLSKLVFWLCGERNVCLPQEILISLGEEKELISAGTDGRSGDPERYS